MIDIENLVVVNVFMVAVNVSNALVPFGLETGPILLRNWHAPFVRFGPIRPRDRSHSA